MMYAFCSPPYPTPSITNKNTHPYKLVKIARLGGGVGDYLYAWSIIRLWLKMYPLY